MTLRMGFDGLWTNPNPHTEVPRGAATVARNVVSNRPGMAEPALGLEAWPGVYSMPDERLRSGTQYGGFGFEHTSEGRLYRRDLTTGAVTGVDAFDPPPDAQRVRFAVAGDDLYMTTDSGVLALDGPLATPARPGMPRALDVWSAVPYSAVGTYETGFLEPDTTVSYRVTWMRKDAEGKQVQGWPSGIVRAFNQTTAVSLARAANVVTVTALTPSQFAYPPVAGDTVSITPIDANNVAPETKTIVSTSSATLLYNEVGANFGATTGYTMSLGMRPVRLTVPLPSDVVAGDYIQIWRSVAVPITTNPGDVLYQVAERQVTAGEVVAGFIVYDDITPEALLGAPLYTNGTQVQGTILNANKRPPLARDAVLFQESLFLADTEDAQTFTFRFLGLPNNLDRITINGLQYTFESYVNTDVSGRVELFDYPWLTVSQKIEATARELVKAVGIRTGNLTLDAFYVSSDIDPPGLVEITARTPTVPAFTVQATVGSGTIYEPELVAAQSSAADVRLNGVDISKRGQPYAFAVSGNRRLRVGRADARVLRILALRESVYALKEDGIFRISPAGVDRWSVTEVNGTLALLVPDSAAVLDNRIWGHFTRGVVAISETGIEEVDIPIDNLTDAIGALPADTLLPNAFAVADDKQQRYLYFHPQDGTDTSSVHALVYNGKTEVWTERGEWLAETHGGYMLTGGRFVLGSLTSDTAAVERSTGTAADYQGPAGEPIPMRIRWTVNDEGRPDAAKFFRTFKLLWEAPSNVVAPVDFINGDYPASHLVLQCHSEGRPYAYQWVPPEAQRGTRMVVDAIITAAAEYLVVVGMEVEATITATGTRAGLRRR